MTQLFHSTRRNFLVRCCQGVALLPAAVSGFAFPRLADDRSGDQTAGFHLHPHYRSPLPLDPLFLKARAGSDQFITEKYAQEIEAIFAKWSEALLRSPEDVGPITRILGPEFSGPPLCASQSRLVRSGVIEVRENSFTQATATRDIFIQELRSVLGHFSRLQTAEFQVTRINDRAAATALVSGERSATRLQTRLRYELVGASANFHREQRVGYW